MQIPAGHAEQPCVSCERLQFHGKMHAFLTTEPARAQQDGVLPLSRPIMTADGRTLQVLFVPKGTEILIGTYGSNVSKDIWGEDALEWKPERWNGLPQSVAEAHIPSVYSHL